MFYMCELSQYTQYMMLVRNSNILLFLRQNYITNKGDAAIILYKIYNKNSIIECELTVYGLDYIVHTALHDK